MQTARFENVSCSQCGVDFGPGEHGFSHCDNHQGMSMQTNDSGHVAGGKPESAVASPVNGGVPSDFNEQQERNRHDAEDLEALHMCLDKHGIPRADAGGAVYSAWGRVLRFVAPRPTDAEILEAAKWTLYPVRPCDENTIAFVRRLQSAVDSRF